jgi:signal transduction histidine kinase
MAFAGLDTMRVLKTIQNSNDAIRSEFLNRNRLLNQIRSDLYLSGTFVRDYLLEPESRKAESHRASLDSARRDMESALGQYARLLRPSERQPFENLQLELNRYWQALRPVMLWDTNDRKLGGYPFLRDEVYPRRTAMLGLADQIGAVNEQQLNQGNLQISDLFSGVRVRLTLVLLTTLGLGAILASYSMRRILVLERDSAIRFQETSQARLELKQLSARLVEAQESERRAISRELHDEVGQSLSALVVGLSNLTGAADDAQIAKLRKLAVSSVGVVRNMALLLRPSMLDDLGLGPAVQWQAREVSKRSGVIVDVSGDEIPANLPEDYKTAVYRVVQEALHNSEKHARAKQIRVTFQHLQHALLLSIQDDGSGFASSTEKGLGLLGMQERIENLGGMFNVESDVGRGTLITVRLPLANGYAGD